MSSNYRLIREDVRKPFNAKRFSHARRPLPVANIEPYRGSILPSALDMLIKIPGGNIQLPEPYRGNCTIVDFIARSILHEDGLLPDWREHYHLYLTIDHRMVPAGKTHRNKGWHFDGMQGERYPVKMPVCHQYLVSNTLPTEYYIGSNANLEQADERRDNWFDVVSEQIGEIPPEIWCPQNMQIVMVTSYQIHRAQIAKRDNMRLFMRLDVSLKQQDRLGNSINPLLPAPWPMVKRGFDGHQPLDDAGWESGQKIAKRIGEQAQAS